MPLLKGRARQGRDTYSMFGAAKREKPFKDYCLILQVHPEADAAMIDAAYWHLAKRYNQATAFDPKARAKIEELNEAYIVLGNAEKRDEYMKVRAQVLGEGALPQVPKPVPPSPPLTVMSRQRPRERDEPNTETKAHGGFTHRFALGAVVAVGIAGVALMTTLSLLVASAAMAAVLAALLAVAGLVAALARLRTASRSKKQAVRTRANVVPAAKTKTEEPTPASAEAPVDGSMAPRPKPGQVDEPTVNDEQIARLQAETRKLRATVKSTSPSGAPRPIEQANGQGEQTVPQAVDRAQIEQIKAETEGLRAVQRQATEQTPSPPTAGEIP